MFKIIKKISFYLEGVFLFVFPFVVGAAELYNPISGTTTVPQLIGKVLKIVVGVIGAIALAMFIFGGFLWMTSAGEQGSIKKGKDTMVYAALGLVIVFSARAILSFIFENLK